VYLVAFTVHLHQHSLKVSADLAEDMPETLNRFAVEHAATALGHEDRMDVHCKKAVSSVSQILVFV
jgi:hypothetical protein